MPVMTSAVLLHRQGQNAHNHLPYTSAQLTGSLICSGKLVPHSGKQPLAQLDGATQHRLFGPAPQAGQQKWLQDCKVGQKSLCKTNAYAPYFLAITAAFHHKASAVLLSITYSLLFWSIPSCICTTLPLMRDLCIYAQLTVTHRLDIAHAGLQRSSQGSRSTADVRGSTAEPLFSSNVSDASFDIHLICHLTC